MDSMWTHPFQKHIATECLSGFWVFVCGLVWVLFFCFFLVGFWVFWVWGWCLVFRCRGYGFSPIAPVIELRRLATFEIPNGKPNLTLWCQALKRETTHGSQARLQPRAWHHKLTVFVSHKVSCWKFSVALKKPRSHLFVKTVFELVVESWEGRGLGLTKCRRGRLMRHEERALSATS